MIMEKEIKIAIEYDDFSPRNSNLALLEEIKEHYPNFKVTLFTTPWEIRFGKPTPITDGEFRAWVDAIKENADWIEIALHGLTHLERTPNHGAEFENISYDEAFKRITVGEKMFINRGIKLAKIFKAPQWQLSPEGKQAAIDCGYQVVEDGYYNWNLKDAFPKDKAEKGELIIGHGHIHNTCGNGMEETFNKIMQMPTNAQFFKLSEII
jgi:hypothetical protein